MAHLSLDVCAILDVSSLMDLLAHIDVCALEDVSARVDVRTLSDASAPSLMFRLSWTCWISLTPVLPKTFRLALMLGQIIEHDETAMQAWGKQVKM